jgi:hypothetical protein
VNIVMNLRVPKNIIGKFSSNCINGCLHRRVELSEVTYLDGIK